MGRGTTHTSGKAARAGLRAQRRKEDDPHSAPKSSAAFVVRPQIDAMLTEAARHSLTALVAPAGTGKTATLGHWARARRHRSEWVTMSRPGADRALVTALARAAHASGTPLPDLRAAAPVLVKAMREGSGRPDVVVIDDAHQMTTAMWRLLETLLNEVPDHLRLVLGSRRDPPLGMVALGLLGEVTVLRSDLLRFDEVDARLLIHQHAPQTSEAEAGTLVDRSQGWAAMLVLGARALGGAVDHEQARRTLAVTHQPVLDYLLGEVFTTLPAATRHVLLCTCALDEVTEDLATLLSGEATAAERLESLAREGLLVIAYDDDQEAGPHWRYHPLMRELLRRRVAINGPDHALAAAAHARAARHYAAIGDSRQAVWNATASQDWDLASALIVEHGPALLAAGHRRELETALHALPTESLAQHPGLVAVAALERRGANDIPGALGLADRAIDAAGRIVGGLEATSTGAPGADATAEGLSLVADATLLNTWQAALGLCDPALALASAHDMIDLRVRGHAGTARGGLGHRWPLSTTRLAMLLLEAVTVEIWTGDLHAARAHADEVLLAAQALDAEQLLASAFASQALVSTVTGDLSLAAELAHRSLSVTAGGDDPDGLTLARAHVALGWSRYASADYSGAAAASAKAHELAVLVCDPFVATSARVLQSCLLADVGAATAARELLADLPASPDPQPAILRWMVAMSRGRAAVQLGDLDDAQRQLRAQQESMWPEGGKVFAALLAHRNGATDEGLAQLEEMLHTDDPALGPIRTAASAILARIAVEDGIRDEAALGSVFDAVSRAAPQQLWQPLIVGAIPEGTIHRGVAGALTRLGHGPAVAGARGAMARYRDALEAPALVAAAALPSASPAWADELSARKVAGTGLAGAVRAGTGSEASSFPSSPMTDRESDVLRELALGGSYTDIALSLFITQNTVKTHLSAIYRKLGVAGRSAALREARRRSLI